MDTNVGAVMLLVTTDSNYASELDRGEFAVKVAPGGKEALKMAANERPGVIVVDLPLSDMPAVNFIQAVREWSNAPVIALADSGSMEAKISLLTAGADDFMVKPVGFDELRARVNVAFRHRSFQAKEVGPIFKLGRTVINVASRTVQRGGKLIHMAPIEFHLIAELVKHSGNVVTQQHLLLEVWKHASRTNLPVLRAYIAILRKKLSDSPDADVEIETIPGVGYRLLHTWSG